MTNPRLLAFVSITAVLLLESAGLQDPDQFDELKDPRIAHMPSQKMLVVESKGDPNVVAQEAFSRLFGTFFQLPGARMSPPRARWLNLASDPRSEWIGLYGLPLPDTVTDLPAGVEGVRIEEWEYGEVAEILHIGPYSEEIPTIEKLHAYILERGYVIAGPHEEEYLKAPGMGSISPEEYQTIIRYPVKKK